MELGEQRMLGVMQGRLEGVEGRVERIENKVDVIYERVTSAKGGVRMLMMVVSVTAALTTLLNNLGAVAKWLAGN